MPLPQPPKYWYYRNVHLCFFFKRQFFIRCPMPFSKCPQRNWTTKLFYSEKTHQSGHGWCFLGKDFRQAGGCGSLACWGKRKFVDRKIWSSFLWSSFYLSTALESSLQPEERGESFLIAGYNFFTQTDCSHGIPRAHSILFHCSRQGNWVRRRVWDHIGSKTRGFQAGLSRQGFRVGPSQAHHPRQTLKALPQGPYLLFEDRTWALLLYPGIWACFPEAVKVFSFVYYTLGVVWNFAEPGYGELSLPQGRMPI